MTKRMAIIEMCWDCPRCPGCPELLKPEADPDDIPESCPLPTIDERHP